MWNFCLGLFCVLIWSSRSVEGPLRGEVVQALGASGAMNGDLGTADWDEDVTFVELHMQFRIMAHDYASAR